MGQVLFCRPFPSSCRAWGSSWRQNHPTFLALQNYLSAVLETLRRMVNQFVVIVCTLKYTPEVLSLGMFWNASFLWPVLLSVGSVFGLFASLLMCSVRFIFFSAMLGMPSFFVATVVSLLLYSILSFFERIVSRFRKWLKFSFSSLSILVLSWMRTLSRQRNRNRRSL